MLVLMDGPAPSIGAVLSSPSRDALWIPICKHPHHTITSVMCSFSPLLLQQVLRSAVRGAKEAVCAVQGEQVYLENSSA